MFRTIMLTCLFALVAILARFSCAETSSPADLSLVDQRVNTLDPQQMSWISDIRLCMNVWEGLSTPDPETLKPISGMARLPPQISADGQVYTFHLRPDTCWSNGDPVTAGDFIRGWRRAIEPGTAADYAFLVADHIFGARNYYEWRQEAVAVLGHLQSLAAGRTLQPAQWELTRRHLSEAGVHEATPDATADWTRVREQFLRRHDAMRDTRWATVGLRAPNAQTLRVHLQQPTPYFLELTLLPVLMPIHESIERLRDTEPGLKINDDGLVVYDAQWTKPDYPRNGYPGLVTNNLFRITEWQFRRRLRLEPNPFHYYRRRCSLRVIDILMFEDANTAFQAYQTGVADWMTTLNVAYVKPLLDAGRLEARADIHCVPAFGTYFYNLNCVDDVLPDGRINPFRDRRVRQAFSISLDRDLLCARVALKHNPPADTLIPRGSIPGYPHIDGAGHQPALADRLLDEAGYADRSTFPEIGILYSTGSDHGRAAEALAHMWRTTLRVRVRLQAMESKTFSEQKAKHNFHIASGGWFGDYADPTTFLDICATANGNNDSGYSSKAFDLMLAEASRITDPHQRLQKLAEAERVLVTEDVPLIPIWQYTAPQAIKPTVHGVQPNAREIYPWRSVKVAQ